MDYTGHLLVAHPNLEQSIFSKSVIFIHQDGGHGSMGMILNKPTTTPLTTLLRQQGLLSISSANILYRGGPLTPDCMVMIHTNDWYSSNTKQVTDTVAVSSDEVMLEKLSVGNEPEQWKLCAGQCAWMPGQLQAEVDGTDEFPKDKTWLVVPATDEIIFNVNTDDIWYQAVDYCSKVLVETLL